MKQSFKHIVPALACLLVCAAYLCSATGFDVHTDGHDGQTYVVSLLKGISCEEIHPDDDCACCHHHDQEEEADCSDEVEVLQITGTDGDIHFDFTPHMQLLAVYTAAENTVFTGRKSYAEELVSSPPRLHLKKNSVLRV